MQVNINSKTDIKRLSNFLSAIVVNKALYWSIHIKSNLERMRALGLQYWTEAQSIPLSPEWAKRKAKINGHGDEVAIATGQTKEQALFLTGDGDMHMTGRGNVLSNINAAEWVPNLTLGSPPWRSRWGDRPFYYQSHLKNRNFWRGETAYQEIDTANKEIWSKPLPEVASLQEAEGLLIMPVAKCNAILKGKMISLGTWTAGKTTGVASKWL